METMHLLELHLLRSPPTRARTRPAGLRFGHASSSNTMYVVARFVCFILLFAHVVEGRASKCHLQPSVSLHVCCGLPFSLACHSWCGRLSEQVPLAAIQRLFDGLSTVLRRSSTVLRRSFDGGAASRANSRAVFVGHFARIVRLCGRGLGR